VTEIWKELKKENGIKLNQGWVGSPRSWLFDFLLSCTKREATILAIAFWHIWEARNTVRNGEAEIHPRCWVEKILIYVDMVLLHHFHSFSSKRCETTKSFHWTPPPEGWVMINVDAAIFEGVNQMGLGLVIRNHNGEFIAAVRQGFGGITNPELAESIAFRHAVQFASKLPYNQIMVALDCLSLINKLQARSRDRSHTGIVVEDIKQLGRASSVAFSFTHVSRICNQVAHVLVKSASTLCESVWLDVPPNFIVSKHCIDRC
jgi:hypothetical protein